MCRLIGYTMFWIAVGIVIGLLIEEIAVNVILILGLLMIGYHLFAC